MINNAWDQVHKLAGEPVEAVVFGPNVSDYTIKELRADPEEYTGIVPLELLGLVLSPEQSEPFMRRWNVSTGYGSRDVHAFYAYTKSWVVVVSEYDGATGIRKVPRHPVPCEPEAV